MPTCRKTIFVLIGGLTLSACSYDDRAIFVTNTSIGMDADAATQKVSLGYDRTEIFTGPVFETGAIPPVVGQLDSNLAIFNPQIEQLYATGTAAVNVTKKDTDKEEEEEEKNEERVTENKDGVLAGDKRVMFFGTSSNTGFQVAFLDSFPRTISFGYKRKEVSIIPLIPVKPEAQGSSNNSNQQTSSSDAASPNNDNKQEYKYGSVLARICGTSKFEDFKSTATRLHQFIATGQAADNLAKELLIKRPFKLSAMGMEDKTEACLITLPPGIEKQ